LGATLEGFIPLLIPFAAGNFIYIAGSDLIPELRRDEPDLKKATLQVASILFGVAIMFGLLLLE
jgi:zinc and cadmium transporter